MTLFLAETRSQRPPRIVGDFNDGGSTSAVWFEGGSMQQIGTSAWYALAVRVPEDARVEYQVRWGDRVERDPLNPRTADTFGSVRSVVQGPDLRRAPVPSASDPHGTLRTFTLESAIRSNQRLVTVYLPPGYSPEGRPLPTLYVKDGTRFLNEAGLPSILDALIAESRIPPVIVVFVDAVGRGVEYGTSGAYRRLVVHELVPEVERRFASGGSPARRGLFGASRGGLAVVDLAIQHPEVFGFTAAMSPALSPLPILDEIAAAPTCRGHSWCSSRATTHHVSWRTDAPSSRPWRGGPIASSPSTCPLTTRHRAGQAGSTWSFCSGISRSRWTER
ncbi:MAG: alpha/beta hydrolase-fold protein [Bacteroidota bacterium]